jgi:hypothetical protein
MNDQINRIFFKDNPFPNGHRIKKFVWSGELDPDKGLIFHFHLETEDYDEEDEEEFEEEDMPDWLSKTVWNNYHKCRLSSGNGIRIAAPGQLCDFSQWDTLTLTADPVPLADDWDPDDLAFDIYLLGHDSCADHRIQIKRLKENEFRIHWSGKIALTYKGEYEFRYEFEANLDQVGFDGIYYPKEYTQQQAGALLATLVVNPEQFEFKDLNPKSFKREYKLVRKANGEGK